MTDIEDILDSVFGQLEIELEALVEEYFRPLMDAEWEYSDDTKEDIINVVRGYLMNVPYDLRIEDVLERVVDRERMY